MPQQTKIGRHPLEAKAVGILQNGRRKINIFSILWSDHNEIVIYRMFEDFKKMHRELRKKFPLESGLLRKSETMIPKLRDVPIFRKNRSSSRFIERLRLLEKFSLELLKTDNKISQCDVVMTFFTPTNSDLNLAYPENSLVIIMPSEVREQQKREQPRQLPQPPASEPIVSQMYMCIEDYETKDTKNRPFKVKSNEQLGVLIKESSGWWLVENKEKQVAWFPAPFLSTVEEKEDTDSETESDEVLRYYTTSSYEAMSCDELSISRGVLVEVMEKSNNGWWLIRYNGKTGFVPAMYLKPYRNGHQLPSMVNLFKASSNLELNSPKESWSKDDIHLALIDAAKANKLDRRKSRSISGLPINTQHGFQHLPVQKPPRQNARVVDPSSGEEMKPKPGKIETLGEQPLASPQKIAILLPPIPQPRKKSIDALAMESTPSTPKEASGYPNSHHGPGITPQVPLRPREHEILKKCTTATRMAIKKREGAVMYS